jgi:CheY-like chemotaxis protein/two-component sensor histidine kinase
MTKLVDDLLDVSRIARGIVELAREDVQITDVLSRAVEMVSPLLEERGHELRVEVPLLGLVVNADPARLSQVVANLLTNAAKYTPQPGHILLQAADDGADVVIRVRDDGEGISAELLPVIFDMFVQGRRMLARAEGGLGLGLSLVKNLVAMHGGSVSASSDGPGRGSEFLVRIPAVASRSPKARSATPTPLPHGRTRRRVLVVDDNKDAAEMLARGLRHFGYDVELALDGRTALERLRTFDAEVALLDLGLPGIDGFELARRIASEYGDRRPRLVAVTGYGQVHDVARSRTAGFDVHLIKPVELNAVVEAIEDR